MVPLITYDGMLSCVNSGTLGIWKRRSEKAVFGIEVFVYREEWMLFGGKYVGRVPFLDLRYGI